ncbi:MAG TPA: hypothetical protein VK112_01080 [Fodinibius sp.]|nr:hypothetical protein [Fodinibius sp.]
MNILRYIFVLLVGALLFVSCKEDHLIEDIEDGPNLAAFDNNNKSVSQIADGSEYKVEVPMKLIGPSIREISGDINVTVQAGYESPGDTIDTDERAIEGTHYRLDQNQVTLKESDNYLAKFTFTMLTDGIVAPVMPTPKLLLKATEVSGGGNVVNSGKPIEVTLNYACDSNLQGTYNVVATREDGSVYEHNGEEVIATAGLGQYQTGSMGGFWTTPGSPYRPGAVLNFGVKFSDVCGNLTVKDTNLGGVYGNEVGGVEVTEVEGDSQTGDLTSFTLKYYITFGGDQLEYTAIYTKQ